MTRENEDRRGRTAFDAASRLSFPRLPGSRGNREARQLVASMFEMAGLEVALEDFTATDYSINIAARWALVPTGVMLFLSALSLVYGIAVPALFISLLSPMPLLVILSGLTKKRDFPRARRYSAANLVSRLRPHEGEDRKKTVILMGHYDSKSQTFSIGLRVFLYIVGGIGGLLLALIIAACSISLLLGAACPFASYLFFAAAVVLAVDLSFLSNRIGNRSDGALDNATGVGLVLETASRLARDPAPGIEVVAVATDAEEIGLCGARDFLERHGPELDMKNTVIVNFDGCGGDRVVSVLKTGKGEGPGGKELRRLCREAAAGKNVPFKERSIPVGMATDALPFRRAGYACLDFIGMASKSHTTKDRMDLVREESLGQYVEVAEELIRSLG